MKRTLLWILGAGPALYRAPAKTGFPAASRRPLRKETPSSLPWPSWLVPGIQAALLLVLATETRTQTTPAFPLTIEIADGHTKLSWPSVGGQLYEVEALLSHSAADWGKIGELSATGEFTSWTDPDPLGPSRLYRVSYRIAGTVARGRFVHSDSPDGLLPDLAAVDFGTARARLLQMVDTGEIILPIPHGGLTPFADLELPNLTLYLDELQRTLVLTADATLLGQPVQLIFTGRWNDEIGPADGFALGVRFPEFALSDWVSGLAGTVLDDLTLDGSILTLATAPLDLNLRHMPGDAAAFYGGPTLQVEAGLNIYREVDLAQSSGLGQPLDLLGITDTTVVLEGFLGVDVNALFQQSNPAAAPSLVLRAHLPGARPSGFPDWLTPAKRVLEFTNNPSVVVRLKDEFRAHPDGQITTFLASTELDTGGNQTSLTISGQLAHPWMQPFGLSWLTLEQAVLDATFSEAGSAEFSLAGRFMAGDKIVTTEFALDDSPGGTTASFQAAVNQLTLRDVLDLLGRVTGSDPFGPGLPDDTLVLDDVRFSFDSSGEQSIAISATTTILETIQADVLFSFVQPDPDTSLLVLGLRVHDFTLSALYAGINGTLAGDLEFPEVAFTVVQELPDPPPEPIEIPSGTLNPAALDFYQATHGTAPFTLEVKAGLNYTGSFPQSKLPAIVLDALGMDPIDEVLLEGSLGLRLGALTGGGAVALDSLNLKAVLPPASRPRPGFPEWLADLQSGQRILEFTYIDPEIEVSITDTFQVELDGALRTFVTSTTLSTDGQQAELTLAGAMQGSWAQPFGVDWLTLDTIGLSLTTDGSSATAALHSSFDLGTKQIALELAITGGGANQLVRFRGSVNELSLSDFIELAREHLGTQVDPFGDSSFDFTFTDVSMSIETGIRSSFSLGGRTSLKGKPADVRFSAVHLPGGGAPRIITGFQMQDWSLADALDDLKGTLIEEFRLDTVALVFSRGDEGERGTDSSELGPETHAFYRKIYGTDDFEVPFHNGLSLIGSVPLEGNSLNSGLDALGMTTDRLFLTGTIPGGIIGLGGGGSVLDGLALRAGLPPVSPPGSPEWFVEGQLALEITAEPSVGFVGDMTVVIDEEILTFSVGAKVKRQGVGVVFELSGNLKSDEPWVEPFGIEWLVFNSAGLRVAVSPSGKITLGFAGDMVIDGTDLFGEVEVTVHATTGAPISFAFTFTSETGVRLSVAGLAELQQKMARVENPNAPLIPLDTMPDLAVEVFELMFAPTLSRPSEAGIAIVGDLYVPSEAGGTADRNFASVNLSVDLAGIVAQAHLGAFDLGPLSWDDALVDLVLTLLEQHLVVSGAAQVGSFFQGDLDLGMTRDGLSFTTTTTIYDQFQAQLTASATFSLDAPDFTVQAVMLNDFNSGIVGELTDRVKARANNSNALANELLRRGLSGWSTFRSDPHDLAFRNRITGFANAAGWAQGNWKPYVDAIQDAMDDIAPISPDNLLTKALEGYTVPGVPGVITRCCVDRNPRPPFNCRQWGDCCSGVWKNGKCWTVPPRQIGGACHEYNLPHSAEPFIEETLIPPLVSGIETILQNGNKSPMIDIERAAFTADLAGLLDGTPATLEVTVQFMQAASRMNLSATWDFNDRGASIDALRDALIEDLN